MCFYVEHDTFRLLREPFELTIPTTNHNYVAALTETATLTRFGRRRGHRGGRTPGTAPTTLMLTSAPGADIDGPGYMGGGVTSGGGPVAAAL